MTSPAVLRGIMGSCLALGAADVAWLDVNAERMTNVPSSAPIVLIGPSAPATRFERLPPLMPPSSDDVPRARNPEPCVLHFERGVAFLSDDQITMLTPIADALKTHPQAIARVEGHADRTGWTGNQGSNLALSDERAAAIVRALGKLGVARHRIRAAAFGDTRPVDDRLTEEALRRNRRAEVHFELTGGR